MALPVEAVLGAMFLMVAPLYYSAFSLHFRSGKQSGVKNDVNAHSENLDDLEEMVRDIREDMATEEDLNTIRSHLEEDIYGVKHAMVQLHEDHVEMRELVQDDFLRGSSGGTADS